MHLSSSPVTDPLASAVDALRRARAELAVAERMWSEACTEARAAGKRRTKSVSMRFKIRGEKLRLVRDAEARLVTVAMECVP